MKIRTVPLEAFREHWICNDLIDGCHGEMTWTGVTYPMSTYEYQHECKMCKRQAKADHKYPRIIHTEK